MHALLIAIFGVAIAAAAPAGSPTLNRPSVVKRKGDYPCSRASPYPANMPDGCYTFCNPVYDTIDGPQQSASARVTCDTAGCAPAHINGVSVTVGYTASAGLTASILNVGATFDWSKTVSGSDSYPFTLQKGDDGYIMFTPKLNRVCGDLKKWGWTMESSMGMGGYSQCAGGPGFGGGNPDKEDTNACFTAAQKLADGTPNGDYTFCSMNGTNCHPLSYPNNPQKRGGPILNVPKPRMIEG